MRTAAHLALLLLLSSTVALAHEHAMSDAEFLQMLKAMPHQELPKPDFTGAPASTQTINMVAKSFQFVPSQITVNKGDTVVLNISVPANDQAIKHGIIMETYIENGQDVARGQTITITFTATTPGQFNFGCNFPTCGVGHSSMIGVLNVMDVATPAPTITSIAPNSGSLSGGTSVTITGTNFQSNAGVTFGSVAAQSVVVTSSTSITAVSPAASAAGPVAVKVTNGDGQSATFASFTYTVPPPSITSISPNSGPTSAGQFVTITGSGFQSGATVTIGGVAATNVNVASATKITALTPLPSASEQVTLPQDVVVTNPDGTKATLSGAFTYTVPPLAITSISPAAGTPSGGTIVILTGAGFSNAVQTSVAFGGVPATHVTVVSPVRILATAPAHASGSVDLEVTVGANSVTMPNGFIYSTVPPRHHAAKH